MLVDLFIFLVWLEIEVITPVAEIAGNHKQSIIIVKIFGQLLSKQICLFGAYMTDNDRYNFKIISQDLFQERHMHFQTMLFFLILLGKLFLLNEVPQFPNG